MKPPEGVDGLAAASPAAAGQTAIDAAANAPTNAPTNAPANATIEAATETRGPLDLCAGALRRSMTLQIWLAVMLMSLLLVAVSSYLVLRLSREELGDIGDALLLTNLAQMQQELAREQPLPPQTLVERVGAQLGGLQVALLDADRRVLAATAAFPDGLARRWLPALDAPPAGGPFTTDRVRALRVQLGRLAVDWSDNSGAPYRVLVGRADLPAATGTAAMTAATTAATTPATAAATAATTTGAVADRRSGFVMLALDASVMRKLERQSVQTALWLLLASGGLAALGGVWLARRIADAAHRLGAAASRIGARDLGERLQTQRLPSELRVAGDALNHMLDRLQASVQRMRHVSSDIAHDLRTPLNNLLGEAQVALQRPRSADEYRAVIESAVEDYGRMSRLIEDLLFLARADETQTPLQREWIDVALLCRRFHGYFEPIAADRGRRLAVDWYAAAGPGGAAPRLWADRSLLLRALANLVNNALHHATPGSQVLVHIHVAGDGAAVIDVVNAGAPIAAEYHQKIFERMFRIDPSRGGSSEGSGLGLAIVRSVMLLHGGTVSVRSGQGAATTFTLRFPAALPAPDDRTLHDPGAAAGGPALRR